MFSEARPDDDQYSGSNNMSVQCRDVLSPSDNGGLSSLFSFTRKDSTTCRAHAKTCSGSRSMRTASSQSSLASRIICHPSECGWARRIVEANCALRILIIPLDCNTYPSLYALASHLGPPDTPDPQHMHQSMSQLACYIFRHTTVKIKILRESFRNAFDAHNSRV